MFDFDLRVEWSDGYLYITEECGSGCKWACNSPLEAGEYLTKYIESAMLEAEYMAEEAGAAELLEAIESYYENRE